MNRAREPCIFISHAWHNETLYYDLRDMLDEIMKHRWTDLSIPRSQGMDLLSSGARALSQEVELQERMIATAREERVGIEERFEALQRKEWAKEAWPYRQLKQAEASLAAEEEALAELVSEVTEIDRKQRIEQKIEICNARINELTKRGAGQRLVKAEQEYLENLMDELRNRDLDGLKQHRRHLEESISQAESKKHTILVRIQGLHELLDTGGKCQAIVDQFRRLDREIESRRARIVELSQDQSPDLYNVFSRADALLSSGKVKTELATRHPTLSLALYERIRRADIVLVIAGAYDQYRSWMEFEFAVAADRGKPIVAVLPPGQQNSPRELRYYVTDTVAWDRQDIQRAIQAVLQRREDANTGLTFKD